MAMETRQTGVFRGDCDSPGMDDRDWSVDRFDLMRAIRRHHRARLLKARRNHYGGDWAAIAGGKLVNTATPCSCWMCGNPRKYTGELTIAELKADLDFEDALSEIQKSTLVVE